MLLPIVLMNYWEVTEYEKMLAIPKLESGNVLATSTEI